MEKNIWKWLLGRLPDKTIIEIACEINESIVSPRSRIVIKGISDLKKIKSDQIGIFRSRVEKELNKPQQINRVKNYYKKRIKKNTNNDYFAELCEKDAEIIWSEIQNSNNTFIEEFLIYLLVHPEEYMVEKAYSLYRYIPEFGVEVPNSIDNSNSNLTETIQADDLEELQRLKSEIAKLTEEYRQIKEEKKELLKSNREFKKNIDQIEKEKNELMKSHLKLKKEIEEKKKEVAVLKEEKNEELNFKIKELLDKEKVLILESSILKNDNEELKKMNEKLIKALEEKENVMRENGNHKIKIINIIDRKLPDGLEDSNSVALKLINPNELDKIPNTLENFDEIWFMRFRLTASKQKSLNEKYGAKVVGFNNYQELKIYYSDLVGGISK